MPSLDTWARVYLFAMASTVVLFPLYIVSGVFVGRADDSLLTAAFFIGDAVSFVVTVSAVVVIGRAAFRLAPPSAIEMQVKRTDAIEAAYIDGLIKMGGHDYVLAWWEAPPKVYMDSSRRSMPLLRDYELWIGQIELRAMRSSSTVARYAKLNGIHFARSLGLLEAYFIAKYGKGRAS